MVAAIIALFAVSTVGMPPVASVELTAEDKATAFLSSVVGLDMTKYTLVMPAPPSGYDAESWAEVAAKAEAQHSELLYPPELGGNVKDEWCSLKFVAGESNISIMSNCINDKLKTIKIDNLNGSDYVYSEPPATDLRSQTKTILQRYQEYVTQVDSMDSSYLEPMQSILNRLVGLSATDITVGNITFQVSKNKDITRIQWIYTDGGVVMDHKRVDLSFRNNTFQSFRDTWRVYSVSGPSVINAEEAYKIALDAAQNCELQIVYENGTTKSVDHTDLSNAFYQMYFSMLPYHHGTVLDHWLNRTVSPSSRDSLTLYPYWQFYFYFNEAIAGDSGIQVSIWGDTKEIMYCSGFGYLGTSGTTSLPNQNNPSTLPALAVIIIAMATVALSISVIALRHRKQQKS